MYLVLVMALLVIGLAVSLWDSFGNHESRQAEKGGRSFLHVLRTGTFVAFVVLGAFVCLHWYLIVATEARAVLLPYVCVHLYGLVL